MQQRYFPRMGGAGRNPRLAFARATASNNGRNTSLTFKVSGNWTAPKGVFYISMARGKGSDGTPQSGTHNYSDGYYVYSQNIYQNITTGEITSDPEVYAGAGMGALPSNYCTTPVESGNTSTTTCYRYEYVQFDTGDFVPAAAGIAATGFGKTFPGGDVAQAAPMTSFFNIKIVQGTVYSLIIPAGGYITFDY